MNLIRQHIISLGQNALEASWKSWAKWLGTVVAVAVCFVWLTHQLENRQQRRTAAAEQLYEQLQQVIDAGPAAESKKTPLATGIAAYTADIERLTQTFHTTFRHTPYAQMSALLAADALYAYKKVDEASAQLNWVMKYGSSREYRQIARRRLAMILFEQKQYDAGLKLLDTRVLPAFMPLYEELRGDFFKAQNKIEQARQAYEKAYLARGVEDPAARFIQLKIEGLGAAS